MDIWEGNIWIIAREMVKRAEWRRMFYRMHNHLDIFPNYSSVTISRVNARNFIFLVYTWDQGQVVLHFSGHLV